MAEFIEGLEKEMKLEQLPIEYQKALPVLRKIEEAGYEAYFVGGSVRDTLLGQPIHDVDIATSAFPEEIKQLFPRTIDIGIEHGTVLVLEDEEQYEITTFRTESAYQDYRRPDHVEFVRSLEEDLKRRDFTINAFALKEDGEIVDLFHGLEDLENQILRAVGNPNERFHEDALRMMRGIRFVSQLGFHLSEETAEAIQKNHALLEKISIERINIEFVKTLLGKNRKRGMETFVETECYIYCPGLKDAGEALLRFGDLPEDQLTTEEQAWTLLLSQMVMDESEIRPFLKAWKCSNQMIKDVQTLYLGLKARQNGPLSAELLYLLGEKKACQVEELIRYFGEESETETVMTRYQALPIKDLRELAIDGKVLLAAIDRKPGKWVSEALKQAEAAVINNEIQNQKEQLIDYVKQSLPNE
ncbi:putative tRNA adenylyltransferase [Enterococcus faecalis 13-SD-W-01]|nr:putative tRNA adenylyltransferase [Enterococcus faecalis 13-SD-W-01]